MNAATIESAARLIGEAETALAWLEQYGKQLHPNNNGNFACRFTANFAGSCHGAKEASAAIETMMQLRIEELVAAAIAERRNTIDCLKETIRAQLDQESRDG